MRLLALVLAITACNGNGSSTDATPVIDIDNGSCGTNLNFTGELVDWDSGSAGFCGVNNAMLEGGGAMDNTAPNGRFEMCIPRSGVTTVTIAPPPNPSSCTSMPGTYSFPAIAVANSATILAGGFFSGRMFTAARQATLGAGVTFDPAKAHVVVHVDGPARAVAITATHGTAQAYNGAWAAGESGTEVFFPNVDVPPSGNTMLSVVGGAIGTGSIPLQAGKLTMVTVLTRTP